MQGCPTGRIIRKLVTTDVSLQGGGTVHKGHMVRPYQCSPALSLFLYNLLFKGVPLRQRSLLQGSTNGALLLHSSNCLLSLQLPPSPSLYIQYSEGTLNNIFPVQTLSPTTCMWRNALHSHHAWHESSSEAFLFLLCKYCTDESINISMCLVWHLDTATYNPPMQILINHSFKWV